MVTQKPINVLISILTKRLRCRAGKRTSVTCPPAEDQLIKQGVDDFLLLPISSHFFFFRKG